jgi:hypothetical protein
MMPDPASNTKRKGYKTTVKQRDILNVVWLKQGGS